MTKKEFSGKSLDEALDNAAQTLGVEKSSLSYNILPAAQGGGLLSKLFSRSVRIEAWSDDALNNAAREAVRQVMKKNSPQKPQQQNNNQPQQSINQRQNRETPEQIQKKEVRTRPQRSDRRPENSSHTERAERPQQRTNRPERTERTQRPQPQRTPAHSRREDIERPPSIPLTSPGVADLFEEYKSVFLKTFEVPIENCSKTADENGNWTVSIQDAHIEDMLARSDKLAVAFEHLFKRLAQKKVGDIGGRIYLTAGQAEEKRQEALREFAFSLAEKVKRTGRSITVASKTSQERRVIHLTLDGQPGIATRSVGSGEQRRLIVYPVGERPKRNDADNAETKQGPGEGTPRRGRNNRRGRRGRGNQHHSKPAENSAPEA